jgi:hypothetical protein
MLNRNSLKKILQVSCYPIFSRAVCTLNICTNHLTDELPVFEPGTYSDNVDKEIANIDKSYYIQLLRRSKLY